MKETGNRKDKNQNNGKKALSVFLAVIILFCVLCIVFYFVREKRAENVYEEMRNTTETSSEVQTEADGNGEQGPLGTDYEGIPQVDFEVLRETNTDICAWITIPGTQVDYPVLQNQSSDNPYDNYYLQHTVEKASGLPGAIYIEPCNTADFSDKNTVIYGHNMKNGTMFGSLHQFEDDTFFSEQEYLYIATPEKNLVYQIFAAVTYSDVHIMGNFDFESETGYTDFLDSLKENRNMGDLFREGVEVTAEDRIVTLSTCIKGQDDRRLLIEAVLVDEYGRE